MRHIEVFRFLNQRFAYHSYMDLSRKALPPSTQEILMRNFVLKFAGQRVLLRGLVGNPASKRRVKPQINASPSVESQVKRLIRAVNCATHRGKTL